jgi:methyl-accepting chemotaxis protein
MAAMMFGTVGRQLAAGFVVPIVIMAALGLAAYQSSEAYLATSQRVATTQAVIGSISELMSAMKDAETGQRGYLLTGRDEYLEPYQASEQAIPELLASLEAKTRENPRQQARIRRLRGLIAERFTIFRTVIEARRNNGLEASLPLVLDGSGKRVMDQIRAVANDMTAEETTLLARRERDARDNGSSLTRTLLGGVTIGIVLLAIIAGAIVKSLRERLGSAVQHVRSSSTELEVAATQQLRGAKEQASATTEVSTTINELLTTSRQITESVQRVTRIAQDTAGSARLGDEAVTRANEAIAGMKKQVDRVVLHMLDLGKKSQEIGGILDVINELAEQTNILAINAAIEAAGAGEHGLRFAVVAEEIRKLADRVGGTTKDVRARVDDVRAAANTTVMATEDSSKSVDIGTLQFAEVARAFQRIAELVRTTADASREIELSIKQQATAIEQVNAAVADVAQTSREVEASSAQTMQTSAQLSKLSRDISELIEPAPR